MTEYSLTDIKFEGNRDSGICIIRPVDAAYMGQEISRKNELEALFVYVPVKDWNKELSPWNAPAVFGDEGFGDGADVLLSFIVSELIPHIENQYGKKRYILAGYSLAGLFALYTIYNCEAFEAAVAASPSVWFPGWTDYAEKNTPQTKYVYLSLGDREEKTRNKTMSAVGDCIRRTEEILRAKDIPVTLEWNEGNHFKDPEGRINKGIRAMLEVMH